MKLKVKKEDILKSIANLQGITNRKTNLTITSCVLIKTEGSGITISATDLETGFRGFYSAEIEEEGKIVLNSKKFLEIVKEYPNDEILLEEYENRWIKIGDDKVEFNIVGMDPDDFTDIPLVEDVNFFQIEAKAFKKLIDQSVVAGTTADEKRAYINGVYFNLKSDGNRKEMMMISTDGGRLAKSVFEYTEEKEIYFEKYELIPKTGLAEVAKFIEGEEKINIGFKGSNFILKKENETVTIRLLEGNFPKYEDILKKDGFSLLKMEKNTFSKMLRRMSILSSSDTFKGVIFDIKDGKFVMTAAESEFGDSKEDIDVEFDGKPFKAIFNSRYFLDFIGFIEDDYISIYIKDIDRPCIIEKENNKNFIAAIMPMEA